MKCRLSKMKAAVTFMTPRVVERFTNEFLHPCWDPGPPTSLTWKQPYLQPAGGQETARPLRADTSLVIVLAGKGWGLVVVVGVGSDYNSSLKRWWGGWHNCSFAVIRRDKPPSWTAGRRTRRTGVLQLLLLSAPVSGDWEMEIMRQNKPQCVTIK